MLWQKMLEKKKDYYRGYSKINCIGNDIDCTSRELAMTKVQFLNVGDAS